MDTRIAYNNNFKSRYKLQSNSYFLPTTQHTRLLSQTSVYTLILHNGFYDICAVTLTV